MSKVTAADVAQDIIELARHCALYEDKPTFRLSDAIEDLVSSVHVRDALFKKAIDLDAKDQEKLIDLWNSFELEDQSKDDQGKMFIILAGIKIISLPNNELLAQDKTETLQSIVDLVEEGLELDSSYSLGVLFMRMFTYNMPPKVFVDSIKNTSMVDILKADAAISEAGE